mgnify:FL=1
MRVFVIGEMASAHDGELAKAKRLVNVAVDAGCDAVKVQFWSDADRLADRRRVPKYYRDIYRRYQIPVEWLTILKDYCGDRIEFMATCFLPEDVKTVSPFIKRFKVSAFESHANDLIKETIRWANDRQIIVSGNEIIGIPDTLASRIGINVAVLYCVTAYPAPLEIINLRMMSGQVSGYSDHSGDIDMGAYAVCAGALIVEAHMALANTDALNPDGGSFAHLPWAFKQYVSNIRKAESVCRADTKESNLSDEEEAMRKYHVVTS